MCGKIKELERMGGKKSVAAILLSRLRTLVWRIHVYRRGQLQRQVLSNRCLVISPLK